MTLTQLICIQLLLIVVSHQVLANPSIADSSDVLVNTNEKFLPSLAQAYDNLEEILSDVDRYEKFRQHYFNKLSKRRAKANLAGLWGVPTKSA